MKIEYLKLNIDLDLYRATLFEAWKLDTNYTGTMEDFIKKAVDEFFASRGICLEYVKPASEKKPKKTKKKEKKQ